MSFLRSPLASVGARNCLSSFARVLFVTCLFVAIGFPPAAYCDAHRNNAPAKPAFVPNGYFEENLGQTDKSIAFLARQGADHIAIGADRLQWSDKPWGATGAETMALVWQHAAKAAALIGTDTTGGRTNYFLGNDPAKWVAGARHFRTVRETDALLDTDVVYRASQDRVRYDLEIKPHGDPANVRFVITGATHVAITDDGGLELKGKDFAVRQQAPIAYQDIGGAHRPVRAAFRRFKDGSFGFDVGAYDSNATLVIDPTLVFSTFVGGDGDDHPYAVQVTKNESLNDLVANLSGDTVTMLVDTNSGNLPTARLSSHLTNSTDMFYVAKLDGDGQALIYATYMGGSTQDVAQYLAVDPRGYASLVGFSLSTDFPTVNAYQSSNNGAATGGWSAIVARLDPRGVPVYSTYFGGAGDTWGYGIAVDAGGNAAVTGATNSPGGTTPNFSFPLVFAAQTTNNGGSDSESDAFVARFNATGQVIFSTFLGGDDDDFGIRVAYDLNGNIYTTGQTYSQTKFATGNALQPTCGSGSLPCNYTNGSDAYLAIHSPTGQLKYASFLGGTALDQANAIAIYQAAVNTNAEVSVGGATQSSNFPVSNAFQSSIAGGYDGFLTTFVVTPSLGISVASSSFIGGSGSDVLLSLSTDRWGNIYVGGKTQSSNFPLVMPIQSSLSGSTNGFVAIVQSPVSATNSQPGNRLRFSSLIGGSGPTLVPAIAADDITDSTMTNAGSLYTTAGGGFYAVTSTYATDFPTQRPLSAGSYSGAVAHGGEEATLTKIGLCNHSTTMPSPAVAPPITVADAPVDDVRIYRQMPHDSISSGTKEPAAANTLERLRASLPSIAQHPADVSARWNASANAVFSIGFDPPLPSAEQDPEEAARAFIIAHPELFHLSPAAIAATKATVGAQRDGHQVVAFVQSYGGIPFFNEQGILRVGVNDAGIVFAAGQYYTGESPTATPQLNVSEAYAALRSALPNFWKTATGRRSPHDGESGNPTFQTDPRSQGADLELRKRTLIQHVGMDFSDELTAQLTYFLESGHAHLAWEFGLQGTMARFDETDGGKHIEKIEVLIDAQDGRVLWTHVTTAEDSMTTFADPHATPVSVPMNVSSDGGHGSTDTRFQPNAVASAPEGSVFVFNPLGTQMTLSFAGDATASPDGWLDHFGSTYYTLGGNNACAEDRPYAETTSSNSLPVYTAYQNYRAYSSNSSTGEFTYTWSNAYKTSNGTDTSTDLDFTLTAAFYWANFAHDYFYKLGFDDAHGNFQRRNFQRDPSTGITLGQSNDEVQVFVHLSEPNYSFANAGFNKQVDGVRPSLSYFIGRFGNGGPFVDPAVDGQTAIHEYTHGVSSRLVGDATHIAYAGGSPHERALDEGYSDFFAASATENPVIGAYLNGNGTVGIRPYAINDNPETLANFCDPTQSGCTDYYNSGIWTSALWDMRNALRLAYGAAPGTQLAEQLVYNSEILLSPPSNDRPQDLYSPDMIEARIALSDAAKAMGGNIKHIADYALACRGLGEHSSTSGNTDVHPVADYTLPDGSSCAGLNLFATGTPNPVPIQTELTYNLTVTNGSPVPGATGPASTGTQVTITLPASLSSVSTTPSVGSCGAPVASVVTCSLGTLSYGSNAEITVTGTPQEAGSIMLSGTVSGSIGGPNTGNPNATVTTTVCVPDLVFGNGFESGITEVRCGT